MRQFTLNRVVVSDPHGINHILGLRKIIEYLSRNNAGVFRLDANRG
jgi:hypothetical protein